MTVRLESKVLAPKDTPNNTHWYAEIEGRWVQASDRLHAERIIDTAKMCAEIGRRSAINAMKSALDLT